MANACDTFTGTGKSKAKIFANSELTAPVTTSSTELYFDGKICASSKVDNSNLIYEADLGTLFEPEDDIVTYRNMQWTKITCKYSSTVEGLGLKLIHFKVLAVRIDKTYKDTVKIGPIVLDVEQEGIIKESDPVDILVSTSVQVKQSDGSYKQTDDSIVLGAEVKVQFVTKSPVSCFIPFRLNQFQI